MISEIIISKGKNQYRVNLIGKPRWLALMYGWWPDGGNIPSYRWHRVESVPKEVEEELKKLIGGEKR